MTQRPSYALISHRESFAHERLKLAENSIRLFQVQRGDKNEPISLRITQYASHRRPPYRAISYTWGSAANLCEVIVNGRVFRVHYNLWSLLFNLRLKNETAFLWADALCIDQANLKERNFHVQLMGRIYDQAQSVIVWLGLPSPDRTEIRAMDFIKEFAMCVNPAGRTKIDSSYLTSDVRHRWETLLRLCQHRYWTRTWIVQEFLRACKVEVMCGASSVDWIQFESLLVSIQAKPFNTIDTVVQILQSRPARLTLRRRARTASTLLELLAEYHDSACTEKRDKIYGILGLASDCGEDQETGQARGVVPDYTKHIVEVYMDALNCVKQNSISAALLPSVCNLICQTLLLSHEDIAGYLSRPRLTQCDYLKLTIRPAYVGTVNQVLPSWTSIRDLKRQLDLVDWGQYVGYEVKSTGAGVGRRSSARVFGSQIPHDMISNLMSVASSNPDVDYLHNYPGSPQLTVAPEHILLHYEDKRAYENAAFKKPAVVIEYNQTKGTIRVGLACTNTRRGDLILQFQGLDTTIICRQVGSDYVLVGKAIMVTHEQLQQEYKLDSVCAESPWVSPCLCDHNPEDMHLETDALSLIELLKRK